MRKLYLFENSKSPWGNDCLSITDDGVILGNHVCSNTRFMRYDLHDMDDRLEKIRAHFKEEPYQVNIVEYEQVDDNSELQNAFSLARLKPQNVEKAGVEIEYA